MAFTSTLRTLFDAWVGAAHVDGASRIIAVAKFEPMGLVGAAVETFYAGTSTYRGITGDEPCPGVLELGEVEVSALATDENAPTPFASGARTTGELRLYPTHADSGIFDAKPTVPIDEQLFRTRSMAGRKITVHFGAKEGAWGDFEAGFPLLGAGEPTWSTEGEYWTIPVRQALLDENIDVRDAAGLLFNGRGGLEGPADLRGKRKPLGYGHCTGARATLVDHALGLYLLHGVRNESIQAVNAVYDRGLALTVTTDYTVDLDEATITLVNPSTANEITVDFEGAEPGGTFIETGGDIFSEVVQTHGGLGAGEVDVSDYNTDRTEVSGVFMATDEEVTFATFYRRCFGDVGFVTPTLDGTALKAVAILNAREATIDETYPDDAIASASVARTPTRPCDRLRVGYERQQNPVGTFLGGVSAANRARQAEEWRLAEGPQLSSHYANSRPVTLETAWDLESDAQSYADEFTAHYRDVLVPVEFGLERQFLYAEVGDVVSMAVTDAEGNKRFSLDWPGGNLLMESGDAILLENGDNLLLEGDGTFVGQVARVSISWPFEGRPSGSLVAVGKVI